MSTQFRWLLLPCHNANFFELRFGCWPQVFPTTQAVGTMSHNTKEFNRQADQFTKEYNTQRITLEKCLQSKVNDDINFVCQKQKSAYLEGVAFIFCKQPYDTAVKCQKGAGERWASDCFDENVAFGQCTDQVLRKLYIYNIETSRKNPNNV